MGCRVSYVPLGELAEFESGGTPSKKNESYWHGSIPWISAKTLVGDAVYESDLTISEEGLESGSKLASKGSLLLLTRGSGLFKRIPLAIAEKQVAYKQDIKCINSNAKGISNKYLFYALKALEPAISAMLETTGIGAGKLATDRLKALPIPVLAEDVRAKVTSIADCIYGKISLNAQLNGYLADLGDALFAQALKENKQEIAYQTVESFCEVKGGKRLPKGSELISDANSHPYIRVRDLNNTTVLQLTPEMLYVDDETQANISRYIVNDGDVIVSVVGTIGLTAYIGNTLNGANLTENCNKLTSFNGDLAAWSYFFLRSPDGAEAIRLGTVGAVQAKLPLKNIKSIEVPFIPALEMEKTVAKLNDILSAIQINLVESLALGELRTTLLPRLISGEIDVSKIDITQLNSHLS